MKKDLKTFKDLEFKKHFVHDGLQAKMKFDNGYGISVVRFKLSSFPFEYASYTRDETEWEVAVLKYISDDEYDICCDTKITNDVIGYLKEDEVSKIMKKIQKLKAWKN